MISLFRRDSSNDSLIGLWIIQIGDFFMGFFFLETSQRTPGRFARWVCGVCLSFCLSFFFFLLDVDLICVNCWWGRLCVFSPCGVVLVHLSGAGAPLVTRATPEGNYIWAHSWQGLLSLELALIMRTDRVRRWKLRPGRLHEARSRFNNWFLIGEWFFKMYLFLTN